MKKSQRLQQILELIRQHSLHTVSELQQELQVSVPTLYRDLKELEAHNLIVRNHGSVELPQDGLALDDSVNSRYMLRLARNRLGKEQIAAKSLNLVHDDDILFADSSTTVYYFVKRLLEQHERYSNLTVVTNSAALLRHLASPPPCITLIAIGGVHNNKLDAFLGRIAVNALEQLHITKAFISAAAVSTSDAYTYHESHAEFLSQVKARSDQTYLLADHLKFNTKAVFPICQTSSFTGIVPDAAFSDKLAKAYIAAGINVML